MENTLPTLKRATFSMFFLWGISKIQSIFSSGSLLWCRKTEIDSSMCNWGSRVYLFTQSYIRSAIWLDTQRSWCSTWKPTKHHQTLPSLCVLLKAIRRWYWLGLACKTTSQQGSNRHDNAFQIFRQYLWCLWGPQDGTLIQLSRCNYLWWFFRLWKWFWLQVLLQNGWW